MSQVPSNLLYTESHEWVELKDGFAKVGITDHAQNELTDIVFVELPEIGKEVNKGDVIAVIESVKVAADIYAPVSGKVSSVNSSLEDSPEFVNESPYDKGWVFQIETSEGGDSLLASDKYEELVN